MKLARPSKVLLVGDTKGVEELFLYFNNSSRDNYPEHPLSSLSQVAGMVEGTPILAFADDESALSSLRTMIDTTFENEKISIGIIASLNGIDRIGKYYKILKNINESFLSRFVFFIDIHSTEESPLPGGYGYKDFIPIDFVFETYKSEMDKLIRFYSDIPDNLKKYCLRAFDLVYFPISTSSNIGLEPSAQALIMEADN